MISQFRLPSHRHLRAIGCRRHEFKTAKNLPQLKEINRRYEALSQEYHAAVKQQKKLQIENGDQTQLVDRLENEVARLSILNWQLENRVRILRANTARCQRLMVTILGGALVMLPLVLALMWVLAILSYPAPWVRTLTVTASVVLLFPAGIWAIGKAINFRRRTMFPRK